MMNWAIICCEFGVDLVSHGLGWELGLKVVQRGWSMPSPEGLVVILSRSVESEEGKVSRIEQRE
jgi:hypothetical protein